MYIVHIASELAPIAKVGGLADVLLGLCRELSWKGHDVDIIIPKYDCMDSNQVRDLTVEYFDLQSFYNQEWYPNTVWVGWVENLKVYFIEPHHPHHFFSRGCIYGCADDLDRFIYFSRAALEFIYKKGLQPDILHIHDWQAALIAPLYKEIYKKIGLNTPKVVFTMHNLEYQGKCSPSDVRKAGLNQSQELQDDESKHLVNLLKGGIVYSDFCTTVSPNYAKEVLDSSEGKGLEKTLNRFKNKFKGILNGVDYSYWNPEIDRFLPARYSEREIPKDKKDRATLDQKAFIKKTLRDKFDLIEEHRPLIGCIARLVPQKGIELIKYLIENIARMKGQFLLLGTSPIPSISEEFFALQSSHFKNPHVRLILHQSEELAHLIYAGSDIFVIPSLFEPCGLVQLIALKYGSVPIVRETGGLKDTIIDVDHSNHPLLETNGYTFSEPTTEALESTVKRAVTCWFEDIDKWRSLMIRGMKMDFSWNHPSNQYLKIYEQVNQN